MAPSTRLSTKNAVRQSYGPPVRTDTRNNPILLEEPPAAVVPAQPRASARNASALLSKVTRRTKPGLKEGAIVKPKTSPKKVSLDVPKLKKKERPAKHECSICATEKSTGRSFKVPEDSNICKHFHTICSTCIAKMLQTKVVERQLIVAELACPFPKCEHVLDYVLLKKSVTKAAFEQYDKAVIKHTLSAGQSYIACLSSRCGLYFSIEDCTGAKSGKQKVACPHCEYLICLKCQRPWKSHGSGGCNKAKQKEDMESQETVKSMGAKPCPKCGMNILKNGGCDHMVCHHCRHNFCWRCLVAYNSYVQHLEGCPHGRVNVAAEAGNWVPDNLNIAQTLLLHDDIIALPFNAQLPPPPQLALAGLMGFFGFRGGNVGAGGGLPPPPH